MLQLTETANLAVIVSDELYRNIVQHGYARTPATEFTRTRVAVKETETDAWIYLD
jgi:anti-sigma regulatory factor (Ser/Thr protein kinase)